ncbi:MAG: aldehyde dehydrogenase [Candidatus Doudnabacteria bacterium]|nr:aldehyde dehydrogenase [Candidatus Doudnabacteria bacterium]
MAKIQSINPSNYEVIDEVEVSTPQEIKDKVAKSHVARVAWRDIGLAKRIEHLRSALDEFVSRKEELAAIQAKEMGMPITEALSDVDGSASYFSWYLDNAEKYLAPETTFESDAELHQVFFEPIGVAAVVIPWNFPFANFVWASIQNLLVGNAVVLKHSEECPLSGKFIEEVMTKHLPKDVFAEVYGDGKVGDVLVNEDINLINFTGSTKTGKYLYKLAGEKFIKAVMELGGSAPGVLFADADLEVAVGTVCFNRLLNQGQCCDGLKRLIVHESIFDKVVEKLKEVFEVKKVGNAEDAATETGPLVAKRQLDLLVAQVEDAVANGAEVVVGGKSLEKELGGAFYAPTILTNVQKDMRVWTEEVFGPVLPIMTFKTEEEAIALANETAYGLGAYVFSADSELAERVSSAIQSGMVSVNGTNYIMPFNPFGGYKNSGFGREHGKYGFHELAQVKIVAKNK